MGNYNGKVVSTSAVLGEKFEYEVNFTGPNYINEKIYYDEEFLDYSDFYIKCADSVECYYDEQTTCSVEKIKDGELLLKCDESEEYGYYIPILIFQTKKEGEASLKIGSEYADKVTIVKTASELDKNESMSNVACKEVAEDSNLDLLTNPFVLGIISGFSIVIVILSVILSRKNKQLKNVQK